MYPERTSRTQESRVNTASIHQKHPPPKYAFSYVGISSFCHSDVGRICSSFQSIYFISQDDMVVVFTNFIEREFTQCRVFLGVSFSQTNTCPRCPPQLAQVISVRRPSISSDHFTRPGIASSKAGHPHPESNLDSEVKSGASHCRQTNTQSS